MSRWIQSRFPVLFVWMLIAGLGTAFFWVQGQSAPQRVEKKESLVGEVERKVKAEASHLETEAAAGVENLEHRAAGEVAIAEKEGHDLLRATQLEIKKGETAAEKEGEKLLRQTRDDLEKAGHWVREDTEKLEAYLREREARLEKYLHKEETALRKEVMDGEKKLGFWLEGRPLSDVKAQAAIAHHNLLVSNEYPSAQQCAECHPGQYREWSTSSHAYAQLSPVYNSMQATINKLTHGTNGDFCVRCHNQVGMTIGEPVFMANEDRLPVTREGISCIVCHRVKNSYGRVSGRFALEKGDITKPMYGPRGDAVLKEVLDNFQVTTDNAKGSINWKENGKQVIHSGAVRVKTFDTPQLCSNCHDVNSQNLFRLEEAYSQFRNSPAAVRNETCQDCHMGKVLGVKSGYNEGPIAHIGGVPTPSGKRTNHMFAGPDYSIVHPGIFPHSPEADSIASFKEWMQFDIEAGWGTDAFEKSAPSKNSFPPAWREERHRRRGREFIDNQLRLLGEYRAQSMRTLRHGYQLGTLKVHRNDSRGIRFDVEVRNATDGHGVPTGFDAERLVFLETTVRDRTGKIVFQSGDRDPNGDVRDLHSEYVNRGEVPLDDHLFSLQSKFLLRNLRGGEREQVLPVPVSQGALPFNRPNITSSLLQAAPSATRKQALIIPPNGSRLAEYEIDGDQLSGKGPYKVQLRFICQMVPVNLVNAISGMGFDYNLSPRDVANRVVEGGFVLWNHTVELPATGRSLNLKPSSAEVLGPEAVTPGLPWLKYTPVTNGFLEKTEDDIRAGLDKAGRELRKVGDKATQLEKEAVSEAEKIEKATQDEAQKVEGFFHRKPAKK
ncbi:MAG: multiheme c-type cytochrome [Verrucomicrobiae bacterium]|nr:multiheme c-type cytochrome [Verrucomicrobiae bacterium]